MTEETDSNQGPITPEVVNPLGEAGLEELKSKVPSSQGGSIELEGAPKQLPELLGAILAFWEKEVYSVLERTYLEPKEIPIFRGLIFTASHGIGGDLLDIPEVEVGEAVVNELKARRSLRGDSSDRFESIMTSWLNVLRQAEAQKLKDSQAMVGLK